MADERGKITVYFLFSEENAVNSLNIEWDMMDPFRPAPDALSTFINKIIESVNVKQVMIAPLTALQNKLINFGTNPDDEEDQTASIILPPVSMH